MTAISVTVSGDSPAEVVDRLRAMADALTGHPPAPTGSFADGFHVDSRTNVGGAGGLPDVSTTPPPKLCTVHNAPLRFDTWQSKSGKACKAWRCPDSTVGSGCSIEWAS